MADQAQKMKWEALLFGDDQDAPLSALWPDVVERQFVRDQINAGHWQMVRGDDGFGGFVYLVYSFEDEPKGKALLVNGLFGASGECDLVGAANTFLDAVAAAARVNKIRLWTKRAGLVKKLSSLGYGGEMRVIEKVVAYG